MKKILTILSEFGYWGEELLGPLETFDAAGYQVDFATPTGKRPVALPPSMDATFVDPPLGRTVVSEEMAQKVKHLEDPKNPRLDNPIILSQWFPDRPYWSAEKLLREMEAYNNAVDEAQKDLQQYDALLIVGGSGPIVDLANNHRVHDLILGFYKLGKPLVQNATVLLVLPLLATGQTARVLSGVSTSQVIARNMITKMELDL